MKTHLGNDIPARVGDVVKHNCIGDPCDDSFFTVRDVGEEFLIDENGTAWMECFCTLYFRPFQKGDPAEYFADGKWYTAQDGLTMTFCGNEQPSPSKIRHTNPDWRPHPEYKGGV